MVRRLVGIAVVKDINCSACMYISDSLRGLYAPLFIEYSDWSPFRGAAARKDYNDTYVRRCYHNDETILVHVGPNAIQSKSRGQCR